MLLLLFIIIFLIIYIIVAFIKTKIHPIAQTTITYSPLPRNSPPASTINVFMEYYKSKHAARQREIDFVLVNNSRLVTIDHLYIIVHNDEEANAVYHLTQNCIPIQIHDARPSYGRLFSIINQYTGDDDINILANSDIAFDTSIAQVRKMRTDEAIALSRWNVEQYKLPLRGRLQYNPKWTQDTWIFRGRINPILEEIEFSTGLLRCDNRIAYIIARDAGYNLFNPCWSIRTYHVHMSGLRNYQSHIVSLIHPDDRPKYNIVGGDGAYVPPCYWG